MADGRPILTTNFTHRLIHLLIDEKWMIKELIDCNERLIIDFVEYSLEHRPSLEYSLNIVLCKKSEAQSEVCLLY